MEEEGVANLIIIREYSYITLYKRKEKRYQVGGKIVQLHRKSRGILVIRVKKVNGQLWVNTGLLYLSSVVDARYPHPHYYAFVSGFLPLSRSLADPVPKAAFSTGIFHLQFYLIIVKPCFRFVYIYTYILKCSLKKSVLII